MSTSNEVIIDWEKYFDAIYCIHYLPYKSRQEDIVKELDRVDVLNSPLFRFKYTYPNVYDVLAAPRMPERSRTMSCVNLTLAYYNIFQESIWLDFKHILILEDDIRFVIKKAKLQDFLEHIPADYDYIQCDKLGSKLNINRLHTSIPGEYYDSNYTGGCCGTGMVAFSKKGMEVATEFLEHDLVPADYILANRDDEKLNVLTRYVSHVSLVQQIGREWVYKW